MRIRSLFLFGAALVIASTALYGQQPSPGASAADVACRNVYVSRFESEPVSDDPCFELAGAVVIDLTDELYREIDVDSAISPRDLQQTNSGDAATGGSVAQGEAVPTVQPMAIGGGSVAAVGSDAGTNAIAALTINPAIFFTTPRSREATARTSRLSDITVFFPVNELDRDEDGDVDYFGIRLRVNMTGVSAGSRVMQRARVLFEALLRQEAENAERLAKVFRRAPNLEACVDTLLAETAEAGTLRRTCGADARVQVDEEQYERFRQQLAAVREEADGQYMGLDVRLDIGDPTLGAVPNASATAVAGGLAFGKQIVGGNPEAASAGIKCRVGIHYTDLEDLEETSFAVDGGLALEVRRPVDMHRPVTLSGGFEFRFGGAEEFESELQTDFLMFRASLAVPITDATGVSINLGAPLIGDAISPTLSINANWGLLLPQLGV